MFGNVSYILHLQLWRLQCNFIYTHNMTFNITFQPRPSRGLHLSILKFLVLLALDNHVLWRRVFRMCTPCLGDVSRMVSIRRTVGASTGDVLCMTTSRSKLAFAVLERDGSERECLANYPSINICVCYVLATTVLTLVACCSGVYLVANFTSVA